MKTSIDGGWFRFLTDGFPFHLPRKTWMDCGWIGFLNDGPNHYLLMMLSIAEYASGFSMTIFVGFHFLDAETYAWRQTISSLLFSCVQGAHPSDQEHFVAMF